MPVGIKKGNEQEHRPGERVVLFHDGTCLIFVFCSTGPL